MTVTLHYTFFNVDEKSNKSLCFLYKQQQQQQLTAASCQQERSQDQQHTPESYD